MMKLQIKNEQGEYEDVPIIDPIVGKVVYSFTERSNVGVNKYGTTLDANNTDDYFKHLCEELQDAVNYTFKIRDQFKHITELVKKHPNDADLGLAVRNLYKK